MTKLRTLEQRRADDRRRQREYRERQKFLLNNLENIAHRADTLEDSIKLAANKGDDLARQILDALPSPDVASLAAWFQGRARSAQLGRSASRNKKEAPTAKRVAVGAS
jgi:hypothetical protein